MTSDENTEQWGEYEIDYSLDGSKWVLPVQATSAEDAKRRVDRAAAFGTVSGPWKSYPAWRGWWVPIYCTVRNAFKRS